MRPFLYFAVCLIVSPLAWSFVVETKGGSEGTVYRVINLDATGAGSLEQCVSASEPRVCVFDVSGTIDLGYHLYVRNPHLTIAGQTAPYPGIALKNGGLYIATSDVIVQHITIMRGDEAPQQGAAISIWGSQNNPTGLTERIIIDHCSLYWGTDETVTVWSPLIRNVVISNSIIAETLLPHATAMLVGAGSQNVSVINNLFISNTHRNPAFGNDVRVFVAGNLIYNHSDKAIHTEPESEPAPASATVVDNVVVFGPDVVNTDHVLWLKTDTRDGSAVFMDGNVLPTAAIQWDMVRNEAGIDPRLDEPQLWDEGYRRVDPGLLEAYLQEHVGANPRGRHSLDIRILTDLAVRGGSLKDCVSPSPECINDAGGWPGIPSNTRPVILPTSMYIDLDGNGEIELYDWIQQQACIRS